MNGLDPRVSEAMARLSIAVSQRNTEAAARIIDDLIRYGPDGEWLARQFVGAGLRMWAQNLAEAAAVRA